MLMVLTQFYDLGIIVLDSLKFFIYAPRLLVDESFHGANIGQCSTTNFRCFKLISFMENLLNEEIELYKKVTKFKDFSNVKDARRVLLKLYFNTKNFLSDKEREEVFLLHELLEAIE